MSKSIVPASDSDNALMGQQLAEQYDRAIDGEMHVVLFGAMMVHLKSCVLPRQIASLTDGKPVKKWGGNNAGTGLKAWISEHAPTVNYNTATSWMRMVEAAREAMIEDGELTETADLQRLLGNGDDLKPAERKERQTVFDFFAGKSRRGILDYKIRVHDPKTPGGNLRGSGPRPKRTRAQIAADKLSARAAAQFELLCGVPAEGQPGVLGECLDDHLYQPLSDESLDHLYDDLAALLRAVEAHRVNRREHRNKTRRKS